MARLETPACRSTYYNSTLQRGADKRRGMGRHMPSTCKKQRAIQLKHSLRKQSPHHQSSTQLQLLVVSVLNSAKTLLSPHKCQLKPKKDQEISSGSKWPWNPLCAALQRKKSYWLPPGNSNGPVVALRGKEPGDRGHSTDPLQSVEVWELQKGLADGSHKVGL